jgi:hypothetical protein
MLEQQQPFKFTFFLLNNFSFWKIENRSRRCKALIVFLFLWFHPITLAFQLLAVFRGENIGESTKAFLYFCATTTLFGYVCALIFHIRKMVDLVADIEQIFNENSATMGKMIEICGHLKKIKILKYFSISFFTIMAIFMPFLTGQLSIPIFIPHMCNSSKICFSFVWLHEAFLFFYLSYVSSITTELFNDLLFVIDAYAQFFKEHLTTVNFSGKAGKENLIRCIVYHRNFKRYVLKIIK